MSTRGEKFAGVTVALVTPFRDGEVDFDGLRRLVLLQRRLDGGDELFGRVRDPRQPQALVGIDDVAD